MSNMNLSETYKHYEELFKKDGLFLSKLTFEGDSNRRVPFKSGVVLDGTIIVTGTAEFLFTNESAWSTFLNRTISIADPYPSFQALGMKVVRSDSNGLFPAKTYTARIGFHVVAPFDGYTERSSKIISALLKDDITVVSINYTGSGGTAAIKWHRQHVYNAIEKARYEVDQTASLPSLREAGIVIIATENMCQEISGHGRCEISFKDCKWSSPDPSFLKDKVQYLLEERQKMAKQIDSLAGAVAHNPDFLTQDKLRILFDGQEKLTDKINDLTHLVKNNTPSALTHAQKIALKRVIKDLSGNLIGADMAELIKTLKEMVE